MGRAHNTYEEVRSTNVILVQKPERKRPFERSRRRGEDNIRMDLRV